MPFILIGILILIFFVNKSTTEFYYSQTQKELVQKAKIITQWLIERKIDYQRAEYITRRGSLNTNVRITIIKRNGDVLADSEKDYRTMDNHLKRPEIQDAILLGSGNAQRFSKTIQKDFLYYAEKIEIEDDIFFIRLSMPITRLSTTISLLKKNIVLISFLVGFSLLFVSYFSSKLLTRPLDSVRTEIEKHISSLTPPKEIKIPSTKELASLAISFNKMSNEIHKKIKLINQEKDEKDSLISSLQEGLIVIDKSKKIKSINELAAEYLNFTNKENVGKNFEKILENKNLKKLINKSFKKNKISRVFNQKEIAIKGTKKRFFLINISPLIRSKSIAGLLVTMNDITLQKQLEKVRQDFVANVSHELKTPITSISGYIEIINNGGLKKEEKSRFFNIILKQINRMNSIIDDLLKLSRIESQEEDDSIDLIAQPLLPVLESVVSDTDSFVSKNNNNINIKCGNEIYISADRQLLIEALTNLIENATKYGDANAEILIMAQKRDKVYIHVENKGKMIKAKHWNQIFYRFYRIDKSRSRKGGGTGLGLAIVKHIILVHNGEVFVSSSTKEKTRFTIALPLVETI